LLFKQIKKERSIFFPGLGRHITNSDHGFGDASKKEILSSTEKGLTLFDEF
jgi:hypothetical protein